MAVTIFFLIVPSINTYIHLIAFYSSESFTRLVLFESWKPSWIRFVICRVFFFRSRETKPSKKGTDLFHPMYVDLPSVASYVFYKIKSAWIVNPTILPHYPEGSWKWVASVYLVKWVIECTNTILNMKIWSKWWTNLYSKCLLFGDIGFQN